MKNKIVCIIVGMLLFVTVFSVTGEMNNDGYVLIEKEQNTAPTFFDGTSYFILLSAYEDGMSQDNEWAVQLRFDSVLEVVEYEYFGEDAQGPLVTEEGVEIRVEIELAADWHEVYYNDDFLYEQNWTGGPNGAGTGVLDIGAVDLFANGATSVYYDDMSLEEVGRGIVWEENFDSYADGSSMHGQGGWKGWDNDPAWTAYVTSFLSQSEPHSVDIAGPTDLIHEYDGYTTGQYIYTAWMYIPTLLPDLDCSGSLSWADVTPGDTVTGTITVSNIGGEMLDWDIVEWPTTWGTWTFSALSGDDTVQGTPVTVDVEVVAPDDPETEFGGEVKIENRDNPSDFCTVAVSLVTPMSRNLPFLELLMERFPILGRILEALLG